MPKAIVLGGGMVGSVMAADLATDFDVTLVDLDPKQLDATSTRFHGAFRTEQADLSQPAALRAVIDDADVVCGALASHLGFRALRTVIEAKKPYCDISFMPEDAWQLDALAKQHGTTAVVDMGVAPGMSNLLAGWGVQRLDRATHIAIYVGGLPVERRWPFEYKAGFAPADVIEEYTRPSRVVEDGQVVVREALSGPELLDFDGLGTLEATYTDGLRSLTATLDVPSMLEKTLRYPGHYELMRVLRHTGLFSKEPVDVRGQSVRPLDLTHALLFPKWTYEEGEEDLTVMRVEVSGELNGREHTLRWELFDRYDRASACTSMSRTTALPCAAVARLLVDGTIQTPGVLVPERLAEVPGAAERVLARLSELGIDYREQSGA